MNPLRMSPTTRRGHANRTLEKRNPPPRGYRDRGRGETGAAGVCGAPGCGAGDVLKAPALSTPALLLLKFISHERDARNSIDSRS